MFFPLLCYKSFDSFWSVTNLAPGGRGWSVLEVVTFSGITVQKDTSNILLEHVTSHQSPVTSEQMTCVCVSVYTWSLKITYLFFSGKFITTDKTPARDTKQVLYSHVEGEPCFVAWGKTCGVFVLMSCEVRNLPSKTMLSQKQVCHQQIARLSEYKAVLHVSAVIYSHLQGVSVLKEKYPALLYSVVNCNW